MPLFISPREENLIARITFGSQPVAEPPLQESWVRKLVVHLYNLIGGW